MAVGAEASGAAAIGKEAAGADVLLCGGGLTRGEAEAFLLEHCPNLWRPLLRLLSLFASYIG